MMFIILKGEVGVYTNYRLPSAEMIRTLGAGDLFADSGLLQDKRAAYTTVALTDAIILPVERNSFPEFLQDEPALAFEIFKDLYLRLEKTVASCKDASDCNADNNHHRENKHDGKKADVKIPGANSEPPARADRKTTAEAAAPHQRPTRASDDRTGGIKLFPEGHGLYELLLKNDDATHLMNKSHTCPICKTGFSSLAVKNSKLVLASTDSDMRSRYRDIEPLYYEVLTCPQCLYSALPDVFATPDKSKTDIARELEAVKKTVTVREGVNRDTDSVFAGYYLALFCAPFCFSKYQLITGKLLYKLSRVYQDAGDETMEKQTAQKALENYIFVYENIGIPPIQEQQICILIGELCLKLGDLKGAVTFFFKAKTSGISTPVLKSHAENRVYDIREMAAACR